MFQFIKLFLISAGIFLIFDIFWLIFAYNNLYKNHIGHLIGDFNIIPAVLFYIIYISALTFFVILPSIDKQSIYYVIMAGAFFGLVCYSTYDLTNLASIKNWSLTVTIIDIIWGTFVTSTTATLVYLLVEKFGGK